MYLFLWLWLFVLKVFALDCCSKLKMFSVWKWASPVINLRYLLSISFSLLPIFTQFNNWLILKISNYLWFTFWPFSSHKQLMGKMIISNNHGRKLVRLQSECFTITGWIRPSLPMIIFQLVLRMEKKSRALATILTVLTEFLFVWVELNRSRASWTDGFFEKLRYQSHSIYLRGWNFKSLSGWKKADQKPTDIKNLLIGFLFHPPLSRLIFNDVTYFIFFVLIYNCTFTHS